MKGFLALALAAVPDLTTAALKRPVYLAFSYDEEVGCLGAPDMIAALALEDPRPATVIVGEPTSMQAVRGHKGIAVFTVTVTGREAHSSLPHLGVSAVMAAVQLMASLKALAERMLGEVWKRMTAKLEGVQLAYKSAVAADREFVRGKADGITNLSLALSRQAIAEAEDESEA